jgi:deoxyribonuclease V
MKYEGRELRRVAGVDVSYDDDRYVSVLVTMQEGCIPDIKVRSGLSREAYTPTLFFLKEGPIISQLVYQEPIDLLFVNGHGICHPYSFGLATVVGLTHGLPTIGFARKLIRGNYLEVEGGKPDISFVAQKGLIVAAAVRTKERKRPVYVSQGFGISLGRTLEEYMKWSQHGKVPEPLRLAHLHAHRELTRLRSTLDPKRPTSPEPQNPKRSITGGQ